MVIIIKFSTTNISNISRDCSRKSNYQVDRKIMVMLMLLRKENKVKEVENEDEKEEEQEYAPVWGRA